MTYDPDLDDFLVRKVRDCFKREWPLKMISVPDGNGIRFLLDGEGYLSVCAAVLGIIREHEPGSRDPERDERMRQEGAEKARARSSKTYRWINYGRKGKCPECAGWGAGNGCPACGMYCQGG